MEGAATRKEGITVIGEVVSGSASGSVNKSIIR
jgi:hypothetical protein